jgi:hypothetical protein
MRQAALDRLEWQITQLRADLEKAARFADEGASILNRSITTPPTWNTAARTPPILSRPSGF